jgi:hypothetical protein
VKKSARLGPDCAAAGVAATRPRRTNTQMRLAIISKSLSAAAAAYPFGRVLQTMFRRGSLEIVNRRQYYFRRNPPERELGDHEPDADLGPRRGPSSKTRLQLSGRYNFSCLNSKIAVPPSALLDRYCDTQFRLANIQPHRIRSNPSVDANVISFAVFEAISCAAGMFSSIQPKFMSPWSHSAGA